MEQISGQFDISLDAAVVTTTYVTQEKKSILYVTHEFDEDEGIVWQFHCGNNDYSSQVLQLVRLDEILAIDPDIITLATLPIGYSARRQSQYSAWVIAKD